MSSHLAPLPENVADLQALVGQQQVLLADLSARYAEAESRVAEIRRGYEVENELLREKIRLLVTEKYGRKSEKYGAATGQQLLPLFDEAAVALPGEAVGPENGAEVIVPAHSRTKPKRQPLPPELPRVEVIHDLPAAEKVCGCGGAMTRIGEEVSEQLDVIPARIQVIRHVRPKYACRHCEGVESGGPAVKIAPAPEQMIPKSLASPGLLAQVLTAKFADALPFYRQETQFRRIGVELKRATLCSWAMKVGATCAVLGDLLLAEILASGYAQVDETRVQVLNEEGRANTAQSYMWVYRGGPPGKPVVIFQYSPTRSGEVPRKALAGFQGYVQTDGYAGYDFFKDWPAVQHVGCMAHIRRKFVEVLKASGQSPGAGGRGNAQRVIDEIGKLYAVEKEARAGRLPPEEVYGLRQEKSRPVFEKLGALLGDLAPKTPPRGLLGRAVNYARGQWERVARYLEDGRVQIDNNLAENAIRPFVIGRKNYLFYGHPEGAAAGATIYSLIETAKANDLEPYAYLCFLFERLPQARGKDAIRALLPPNVDPAMLHRPYPSDNA